MNTAATGTASTGTFAQGTGTFRQGARGGGWLRVDVPLVALVSALLLLGLVMVTSASVTEAARESGDAFLYLERQLGLVGAGLLLALVVAAIPVSVYERLALPLLGLAVLLLLLVLVPGIGHVVKGARRWLQLPGMNFQVSEAARVLVLVYIAHYCVRFEAQLRSSFGGLGRALVLLLAVSVLLLAEPDFGAAAVLFTTAFGLLFLAGAQLRWVLAMAASAGAVMALLVVVSPYRLRRLTGFLDPWQHAQDSGFQLVQSLIAIGRGNWFGVGLGGSVQKLMYLPEAHNDFLFAVLAEELGLVGVVLVIGLFVALSWRVLQVARRAHDAGMKFHCYLAAGFGLWVLVQALINIGVNMGALPTKGLTLPLMSYGRSSMLVSLAWLGIVMRVHHEVAGARAPARARVA